MSGEAAKIYDMPPRYSEGREREIKSQLLEQAEILLEDLEKGGLQASFLASDLLPLIEEYKKVIGADNVPNDQIDRLRKDSLFIIGDLGSSLKHLISNPGDRDAKIGLGMILVKLIDDLKAKK